MAVSFPNQHNFVFPVKDLENDLVLLTPFDVRPKLELMLDHLTNQYDSSTHTSLPNMRP